MTVTLTKRSIAYHEAGHAVAHYFYPLAGKTWRIVVGKDELADYNAGKHPVNEALGLHTSGKTLSPIVGRSVDHEQVHHKCVALLSGCAAEWICAGGRARDSKSDPLADAEKLKHSDGSDDFSRCWNLISDADPLDSVGVVRLMPSEVRENKDTAEEYSIRAIDSYTKQLIERFEVLWRESVAFMAAKWPHVQIVGDAAARKLTLEADEIIERIERIEGRLHSYPPHVRELLERLRA